MPASDENHSKDLGKSTGNPSQNDVLFSGLDTIYYSVFEQAATGIFISDTEGNFLNINKRMEEISGYSRDELRNMNCRFLFHPDDLDKYLDAVYNLSNGHLRKLVGERRLLKKGGGIIWFLLNLSMMEVGPEKNKMILGVIDPITERKQAEDDIKLTNLNLEYQIRERTKELEKSKTLHETITKVQYDFINGQDDTSIFFSLLEGLLEISSSDYGFIAEVLYDESQNPYLKTRALTNIAWDEETQILYEKNHKTGFEFKNLNSLFGHALTTKKVVISNDPKNDPRRAGLPEGHPPLNSFLGIPLFSGGVMNGMIGLANKKGGYNEKFIEYIQPFSSTCASIIENYRVRKKKDTAESALRESEGMFKSFIEQSPDGIFILDHSGHFVQVNEALLVITGFSRDELLSMRLQDLIDSNFLEEAQNTFNSLLVEGKSRSVEICRNKKKDKIFLLIDAVRHTQGNFIGYCKDVTNIREVEERYSEVSEFNRTLIEASIIGIASYNSVTGQCVFANEAIAKIIGGTLSSILAQNFRNIESWRVSGFLEYAEKAIASRKNLRGDFHITSSSGKELWLEGFFSTFYSSGELLLLIVVNDITDRKLHELIQLKHEVDAKEALQKEKELGELKNRFITTVSHEFKTPLSTIQTSLDLLEDFKELIEGSEGEKFNKYLYRILISVNRMEELLNDILILGRIEAGRMPMNKSRVDLSALIQEVIEMNYSETILKRKIQFQKEGEIPEVILDPNLFNYILSNLINNALKYSQGKPDPVVSLSRKNGSILLKVEDFGVGIPEKEKDKIFLSFFRASNAENIKGSGIGLVITKQLVEMHNGSIYFESTEGKGSVFYVEIPEDIV